MRFIPTGVGNTMWSKNTADLESVHPHGCGEHRAVLPVRWQQNGSSPRVWGTRVDSFSNAIDRRFIPTGVGNTWPSECRRCSQTVHPHGCGEHPPCRSCAGLPAGSSPRVWGTLPPAADLCRLYRFIPTGVGNTERIGYDAVIFSGSSPRVWGTRTGIERIKEIDRFIPTGVGNTVLTADDD